MKNSLSICLVENHQDTRDLLMLLLTQQGHAVRAASSCAEARALLSQERFDVVLSDIGLADGSGWDLLAGLKDHERPPYAIAMSGYGALSDRQKSAQAGFRHHLVKPLEYGRLLELLEPDRITAALPQT